jgi:hypothetical protein
MGSNVARMWLALIDRLRASAKSFDGMKWFFCPRPDGRGYGAGRESGESNHTVRVLLFRFVHHNHAALDYHFRF